MSAAEETTRETFVAPSAQAPAMPRFIMRFLEVLSSVRFGIVLLILLVALSMVGMLIMQQEVDGFDHYFEELTPSQRREQQARALDTQIAESIEALHELKRRRAEL